MIKHFKLCCAHKEITRLNIEIYHLQTFIHYKILQMNKAMLYLTETNPHLAAELKLQWQLYNAINIIHLQCLNSVEQSASFTGICRIGVPVFTPIGLNPSNNMPYEAMTDGGPGGKSYKTENEMDEAVENIAHDLEKITKFVLAITD
jgi:hypothetical protein